MDGLINGHGTNGIAKYVNGKDGHTNGNVGVAQPDLNPHQRQYLAKMLAQLAMSRGLSACLHVDDPS